MTDAPADCFVVDSAPSVYPLALSLGPWHSCLYDRIPGTALGDEKNELLPSTGQDLRLCFNCGSPDHAVASCPEPIDRQLVALSRQLFNFLHPDPTRQEVTRFYIAEGWKQQRIEWLVSFEPGVIRYPLLRDALGLQEGDPGSTVEWLRNMTYWGYPPGWVGLRDPRELVCSRILDGEVEGRVAAMEWESFTIFGDTDDDEEMDLTPFSLEDPPSPASSSPDVKPIRWATYPNTYFSSTALSIYDGVPLGSVTSSRSQVNVTFTPERRALWERILSGNLGMNNTLSVPPWRLPDAFSTSVVDKDFVPPPPSTTPPPLPLTPDSRTPQKCSALSRVSIPSSRSEAGDRSVIDMDMSDNSE